jgi:hypothetical protein
MTSVRNRKMKNKLAAKQKGNKTNASMYKRVFWVTRLFGYFFGNEKSNMFSEK